MKLLHNITLRRALSIGAVCAHTLLGGNAAWAQAATGGAQGGPPAEAIAACKTLASGQECSFSSPRGTAKGSCWAPEGKPLACRPKDAPAQGEQTSQPKKY